MNPARLTRRIIRRSTCSHPAWRHSKTLSERRGHAAQRCRSCGKPATRLDPVVVQRRIQVGVWIALGLAIAVLLSIGESTSWGTRPWSPPWG